MQSVHSKQTIHDRVVAVFKGEKPDRLPFIDRLAPWYTSHLRAGTLPEEFAGMRLTQVHQAVGMGQQEFYFPFSLRLRGVEVTASFDGRTFYREKDPIVDSFPLMAELVDMSQAGTTTIDLVTPIGTLTTRHRMLEHMIVTSSYPYLMEHLIKEEADFQPLEYIIEYADYIPRYERLREFQAEVGPVGYVVPLLPRIPFQQILLDYLGEVATFYALHDQPGFIQRLLSLLDQQLLEILHRLEDVDLLYVEFRDNLHSEISNPRLFKQYCLPAYQRYTELLHGQGKKTGTHTDGNLKPLLGLLAESGLDVCESFSPAPLTECTFEAAWDAWSNGPIIWGGVPSPILEERTTEGEFKAFIQQLLETIGSRPIILGVGDMVLSNNLIERVRYVAEQVEAHVP